MTYLANTYVLTLGGEASRDASIINIKSFPEAMQHLRCFTNVDWFKIEYNREEVESDE